MAYIKNKRTNSKVINALKYLPSMSISSIHFPAHLLILPPSTARSKTLDVPLRHAPDALQANPPHSRESTCDIVAMYFRSFVLVTTSGLESGGSHSSANCLRQSHPRM